MCRKGNPPIYEYVNWYNYYGLPALLQGTFQPKDQSQVSPIAGGIFTV